MANVYIISETSFKDFTVASANMDTKNIAQVIKMCQDRYIEPITGTALYDKLLLLISNGTIGNVGNVNYKNLIDNYLTDVLFNYVLAELPMALQYKYVNKGVLKRTSENTEQPSFDELQSVMAFYRGYAEDYAEKAINYLCANGPTLFPEYLNPGTDITTVYPVSNQYRTSIYLGSGIIDDPRPYSEKYQGNRYKKPY